MIRTIPGAVAALQHHGHLVLSRHPAEGDTWTICRDPEEPGSRGSHLLPEGLARKLIQAGLVEGEGGRYTLTARLSGLPASSSTASSPASARPHHHAR